MTGSVLQREEGFHDRWAEAVDLAGVLVDESFEACTAPEGRQIIRWLGDLRGRRVLDLGCGLGEAAVYFAKQGARATAADLSGGMLDVARRLARRHGVTIDTHKCSATRTQLPDKAFDVVYAGNLLHHVDVEATLVEVRRILADDGTAVFWDPLTHNPLINVYRRMASGVRTSDEHPLHVRQLELFRRVFGDVRYDCFWFFTLWVFLRFYLVERVKPNQQRYWKKIIREHERLAPIYTAWEKWDRWLLARLPFLKRYCWNIVIACGK